MKFKLKAWMIYLIGIPITALLVSTIEDDLLAGELFGIYFWYGGIALIAYYVGYKLWFGKHKNKQDQLRT